MLKQITVFLENKCGRLKEMTGCLAENGINLHALTIADTTDYGVIRMIASDSEKAVSVLKNNDFMVKITDVYAVALGHNPGSLHNILSELKRLNIQIEYMYALTSQHDEHDAIVIFRLDDSSDLQGKLAESKIIVLGSELLEGLK